MAFRALVVGYAGEEEFGDGLPDSSTFLIVAEGNSDAKILRHAAGLLRPEIADFFRYVDMEDGYPFSGTGNLQKLFQVLSCCEHRSMLSPFLTMTPRVSRPCAKTAQLYLRESYRVCRLPDLPEFVTRGPTGDVGSDINGRAAAIECYLDLARLNRPALVEWGGFNRDAGQ